MVPEIKIKYSPIYDEKLLSLSGNKKVNMVRIKETPKEYIERVSLLWNKVSHGVLRDISDISGLEWKEKIIKCYVVRPRICFSDPLTIGYFKEGKVFIDVLCHELIHVILSQNEKVVKKSLENLKEKYNSFGGITRVHIIIHVILKEVLEKNFGKESLDEDISRCAKFPDYKKAWEIVLSEGSTRIIDNFKKNYNI